LGSHRNLLSVDRADQSPTAGLFDHSAKRLGDFFLPAGVANRGEGCHRQTFEKRDGAFAVIRVTIAIAVDEMRPDFPQVACSNRLIAAHTKRLLAGRPVIHHDESHVAPPNAKQQTASPTRRL
jgi:hypothetical protein